MSRAISWTPMRARPIPRRAPGGQSPWPALVAVCASMFMMRLDGTIVTVGQAEIRRGLDAGLTELQWVVDGYLLAFAVPLLAFGRLGDVYGRRRLFVIGTAMFTGASILCATAGLLGGLPGISGARALIGARVLQGVGAAILLAGVGASLLLRAKRTAAEPVGARLPGPALVGD